MPEITKTYQLKITVEQFLKACSNTELREIDLLIGGYLNPPNPSNVIKDWDAVNELALVISPAEIEKYSDRINNLPEGFMRAFVELLKYGFTTEAALECIPVIKEISDDTPIAPIEVIGLMRTFQKLEKIRLQSLVKRPQLLKSNPVNPKDSDNSN